MGHSATAELQRFDPLRIPRELRLLPQWVVFRIEQRDGKATKVPYRVDGRVKAKSDTRATWSKFEAASLACELDETLAGVGFVFATDDPYVGIDLDHCVEDGELAPWVIAIRNLQVVAANVADVHWADIHCPRRRCRSRRNGHEERGHGVGGETRRYGQRARQRGGWLIHVVQVEVRGVSRPGNSVSVPGVQHDQRGDDRRVFQHAVRIDRGNRSVDA